VANLALVFGLLFLGWGVIWDAAKALEAILPGLRDLTYGFWFVAAILGAYIVRKPGAALHPAHLGPGARRHGRTGLRAHRLSAL